MTTTIALFGLLAAAAAAPPAEPVTDSVVLTVGSNRSVDGGLAPLRYADDDAILYADLFRTLGARAFVVTRPDENTRRVHPELAAAARPPVLATLERTVAELGQVVAEARARGHRTRFYFTYAGHGNLKEGVAYLTVEDARLDGGWLNELVGRVGADESHLIIDACHATLLAYGRGPGGAHRPVEGFVAAAAAGQAEDVGLLLSSSVSGETHEWEGFQAGVFSHEVRSGLYGAADVDGDGQVSYAEIAAFIGRANDPIPNERYRPDVLARPSRARPILADLRRALGPVIQLDGAEVNAHYALEDARGVRVADFHSARGQALALVRPPSPRLYLRRLDDHQEFELPPAGAPVVVSRLAARAARSSARGAEHEAFSLIFSLAFDRAAVARYQSRAARAAVAPPPPWQRPVALGCGVLAVAAGGLAAQQWWHAHALGHEVPADESQVGIGARNEQIHGGQRNAVVLGIGGAVLAAAALGVLLWGPGHGEDALAAADGQAGVVLRW